ADNQKLTWSAQYRFVRAESSGFNDMPTRQTAAFFVAWSRPSKNGKSALTVSARQAFSGQNRRPFTPAAGWTWTPAPAWAFRAHIARSFRLPSLNDLYWTPGGNPELRPEAGWSEELGLTFRPFKKDGAPAFSTTFFNRLIKNQIIWLPGASGIWSPSNVGRVWSRGVENEVKGRVPAGGFFLDFSLRHDLVFSTNQTARFDQDATFGKQLIYVPKNRFSAYIELKMKWLDIFLSQNYTSKVYTLADNSEALPGWARTDAGLGISFHKIPARLYFSVQNIWNKSYEVVRTYPMPGRHAALRFSIDFSKD
ncbi:MAG: TonB-dependent receptor, partial [Bacteroidetes bacterium]